MAGSSGALVPAILAGVALAFPAAAQTSAGALSSQALNRQQAEARSITAAPPSPVPRVMPESARETSPGSDSRFMLRAVTFDSSHFLAADRLDAIAAPYLGHEVGRAELDGIVAAVNVLYDRRGLVTARAVLGPVTDGSVRIELVEGKAGAISVTGNGRVPVARVIERAGLAPGDTVDAAALRHRLSLLNRASDAQTHVALQPGQQFGLTDIALSVTAPKANVVQLFGDDDGYDSAGRWEGSVYYRRTGILGASDRFTGFFSGSAGLLSGTASYDAPLLGPTARLGVAYGRSRIDIIDGPLAALQSRGLTESESINFSQPVASSERGILVASLTAGISNTRDYLGGEYRGDTRTHRAGAGLSYSYAAPGTSLLVAVNGLYANAPVGGSTAKSDFAVFSGTGSAEHRFGPLLGLHLAGGWQVATASDVSSDLLFQIGGATTVRGYRQGELTGDGGYWFNLEAELLPLRGANALTLFAFADQGRVFTRFAEQKSLIAVGLGAGAALGKHISLRATAGLPLERIGEQPKTVRLFGRLGLAF